MAKYFKLLKYAIIGLIKLPFKIVIRLLKIIFNKKVIITSVLLLALGVLVKFLYSKGKLYLGSSSQERIAINSTLANYKEDVLLLSKKFDVPSSYLFALIMLEASGRKKVPSRYEKHIYEKLRKVKNGSMKSFENIKTKDLRKFSDKTVKKLACSYGPFQIMGYKSIFLKTSLSDLEGDKNMYYAVKWIKLTYGKYLDNKNYKDAFHIHNSGRRHPKFGRSRTHDPNYVTNGLRYERIFRNMIKVKTQ